MTMVLEPPAVRPAGRLTVEDLERLPGGDDGYELVEGVLVEKQMGALSSAVSMNLALILGPFCKTRQLGRIFDAECGYRLFPDRPDVVRKPDVSFVSLERLPRGGTPRGFFTLAPDLAAEVLSPRDLAADLDDKIADYLAAGVRQVWVLNPDQHTVTVYTSDRIVRLTEPDTLEGGDVLPGFQCRVAELFEE